MNRPSANGRRRRHFIDVGAHLGQSLDGALHPRFDFATLHAFEPSKSAVRRLYRYSDPRVIVHNIALSNSFGLARLSEAGGQGASLHGGPSSGSFESVVTVDASEYLSSLSIAADDEIYMKINCEGSEFEILKSMRESGFINRITAGLVSLDRGKKDHKGFDDLETLSQFEKITSAWTVRDPIERDAVARWLTAKCPTVPIPEIRIFSTSIAVSASSIPLRTRIRINDGSRLAEVATRIARRFGRQARFARRRAV